jgi:hypothetical protein
MPPRGDYSGVLTFEWKNVDPYKKAIEVEGMSQILWSHHSNATEHIDGQSEEITDFKIISRAIRFNLVD